MNAKINICMLAHFLDNIKCAVEGDVDTLLEVLPPMINNKENRVIDLNQLPPEQADMVDTVLEVFGDFSKKLKGLSELLARIVVDKDKGTVTLIGTDNTRIFKI